MKAKRNPKLRLEILAQWHSETWARWIAPQVLAKMPRASREKLPLADAVQLAALCDVADFQLRAEAGRTVDSQPGWELIRRAFLAEFGLTLDFMARVRRVWFKERGARNVALPKVEGFAMAPDRETKRVKIKPATIAHWMRRSDFKQWAARFSAKHGRNRPDRKDIAAAFGGLGYEEPTPGQVTEAFDLVGEIIRKPPTSEE